MHQKSNSLAAICYLQEAGLKTIIKFTLLTKKVMTQASQL